MDGIRVNSVAPAQIGKINEDFEMMEQTIFGMENLPLKRIADPAEIADAFVFLASGMATYVSGQILAVDGAVIWPINVNNTTKI